MPGAIAAELMGPAFLFNSGRIIPRLMLTRTYHRIASKASERALALVRLLSTITMACFTGFSRPRTVPHQRHSLGSFGQGDNPRLSNMTCGLAFCRIQLLFLLIMTCFETFQPFLADR